MKLGYFPGCSLTGTAKQYDESLREVCKSFDIELVEVRDWNCCGATAAHSLNKLLSIALPARNLALAEQQGLDELLIPCAACYSRMLLSYHESAHDETLRKKIPEIIELPFERKTKPINILEFIQKYILPGLKEKVVKPFAQKAACYYGCLLVRPPKLTNFERYEDPLVMENILKVIGGEPLDWAYKTECCGAGLSVSKTEIVSNLSGKILADASDRGAKSVIVACPMCHSNLDMRRSAIDSFMNKSFEMPVLFITQAIGLSIGIPENKLGFRRHFVPVNLVFNMKNQNNKAEKKGQEA